MIQRDATVDKLYLHEGRLLTVGRIYTRTERGQPRLLTGAERTRFLGELAAAAASLAPPDPWAAPAIPPETRARPDSVIIDGRSQILTVTVPERIEPGARYPLIVDLAVTAPPAAPAANTYVVIRTGKTRATGEQIAAFMRAKYPIDPARISITPAPKPPAKRASRRRR